MIMRQHISLKNYLKNFSNISQFILDYYGVLHFIYFSGIFVSNLQFSFSSSTDFLVQLLNFSNEKRKLPRESLRIYNRVFPQIVLLCYFFIFLFFLYLRVIFCKKFEANVARITQTRHPVHYINHKETKCNSLKLGRYCSKFIFFDHLVFQHYIYLI